MKWLIATLVLIAFVSVGGFGLVHSFQMTGSHEHAHMASCEMAISYISICKVVASTYLKYLSVLLLVLCAVCVFFTKDFLQQIVSELKIERKRFIQSFQTLFEFLYSRGVLNPKAP